MKILELWPWGLGLLGIAAVVGIVLSPVAALKLAKEIGTFLLERARAIVRRLREVEDWWRVTAVALGMLCLGFAFAFVDAEREVVLVQEQCQTRVLTIEHQVQAAVASASSTRRALQQCTTNLSTEVGKAARAEQLEREATAKAEATANRARLEREEWERTYSQKPATCQAALEAMEAACPTLSDY